MISSGSFEMIRETTSFQSWLSAISKRRPAFRRDFPLSSLASSGPWHLKQLAERMGRMSFEKEIASESLAEAAPVAPKVDAIKMNLVRREERSIAMPAYGCVGSNLP